MTRPLITLTAADLDGCRPLDAEKGMIVLCVMCESIILGAPDGTTFRVSKIQCHPFDYIRAWLGPAGERAKGCRFAYVNLPKTRVLFERYCEGEINIQDGWQYDRQLDCPAALASAMGDGVWKRNNDTWEPVWQKENGSL